MVFLLSNNDGSPQGNNINNDIAQQLQASCCCRPSSDTTRTIVITGANSGIGLEAAKLLLLLCSLSNRQTYRLVLVCRTLQKAQDAAEQVRTSLGHDQHQHIIIPLACDQSSIASVYTFNDSIRQALAPNLSIDILCLNAAILPGRDDAIEYTCDGLEQTFQINYLSTFLLANLLVDIVTERMILSSSGLFLNTKLDISGMLQQNFQMPDGSPFHYKRAYALSKVYIVALCGELQRRYPDIIINSFSPGLMMESGLFRRQTSIGVEKLRQHNPHALLNAKSVTWGAGALVYMMLADATGQSYAHYWSDRASQRGDQALYREHFTSIDIVDCFDRIQVKELWRISQHLVDKSRPKQTNEPQGYTMRIIG